MLYISRIWETGEEIVKMRLKSVLLLTDYCYIDIRTAINVQDRTLGIWWCSDLYNVAGTVHTMMCRGFVCTLVRGGIIDIMDQSIWTLQNNRNLHRIDIKMWELKTNLPNYISAILYNNFNFLLLYCTKVIFLDKSDKQKIWGFIFV